MNQQESQHKQYQLPSLPYDFGALEPVISAEIMNLHYMKHHQTYVNNLNKALEQYAEANQKQDLSTMESLLSAIKFNGGGHINHSIFWTNLSPKNQDGGVPPSGALAQAIQQDFGSLQNLIDQLSAKAVAIQGSGWGWLGYDQAHHRLALATCDNQDPLVIKGLIPLLGIDVWEHSYYLQYKNARADYVKAIWNVVNRMIRVVKNRFGPTDEIAVFQMKQSGLVEVPNPSEIFLEERRKETIESVIIPTLEGSRPILVEVQALVTDTVFSTPSRRCTGLDQNRLALLLAVLEKRMKYHLHRSDVFVSVAGGLRIMEPAIDLGILLASASSMQNRILDPETIVVGEVGLGGEVRSVSRIESRLKEAIHMGFQRCIIPKRNLKGISEDLRKKIQIRGVEFVEEAIHEILR